MHSGKVTFEAAESVVRKAAHYLGVKLETYKITDQETGIDSVGIRVADTKKLRNGLKEYESLNKFSAKIGRNPLFRVAS